MVETMDPAERQSVLDAIPLRRLPELGEIVEPILFLASDAASYITGVVLDVNGGRFMPP
jgi:3-oxoacyl-[acyl-carrier protein] reductase